MLFFMGLIFGGLIAYLVTQKHYEKRLQKAFWLWLEEKNIKGIIFEEELKKVSRQFDDKTKGIITIEKEVK